jgi:hypothetical protein
VVTCTHRRSTLCCTTGHTFPSILPWYGASCWSEPITVPSRDRAYHPFAAPTLVRYPRRSTLLVVADLGILAFPRQWVTPTDLVTPYGNTGLGTLPLSLPQSIIDRQNREFIRGNPPILKLRAGRQLLQNGTSVDMHEGKDTTDSPVPFQTLWLTIFYGTRITGDIGY